MSATTISRRESVMRLAPPLAAEFVVSMGYEEE